MNNVEEYLESNRREFRIQLDPYIAQLKTWLDSEDTVFHNEIIQQFCDYVLYHMINDISRNTGDSYEDIMCVVEDLDLKQYLDLDTYF